MHKNKKAEKLISRIGDKNISDARLYKSIYKTLGIQQKLNQTVNPDYVRDHTTRKEMRYHPFWMAKNLIVADRPPFPPKKIPRIIFVDAVSGYRGLFSHVPPINTESIADKMLTASQITEEHVDRYIKDVQEKQINRSYILKKPRHENKATELVYLPIWEVTVRSSELDHTFYINGNTGESEQFISERWRNGKDLLK